MVCKLATGDRIITEKDEQWLKYFVKHKRFCTDSATLKTVGILFLCD